MTAGLSGAYRRSMASLPWTPRRHRWSRDSRWLPTLVAAFGILLLGAEITDPKTWALFRERPVEVMIFLLTFATIGLSITFPGAAVIVWLGTLVLALATQGWEFVMTANMGMLLVAFALWRPRRAAALLAAYLGITLAMEIVWHNDGLFWLAAILSTAPVGIGLLGRSLETRAQRRDAQVAIIDRRARATAEEERTALSRDVHDILSYRLSAIHDTANGYLPNDPPLEMAEALSRVTHLAAAGLEELGSLLLQLRSTVGPFGERQGPPVDLAAETRELAQALRDSGRNAVEQVDIDAPIPRAMSLAMMRILQESATNIMRYSPARSTCSLRVKATRKKLTIVVTSQLGSSPPRPRTAHLGIQGMQERAEAWGGTARIGPENGRWVVDITVPLRPTDTVSPESNDLSKESPATATAAVPERPPAAPERTAQPTSAPPRRQPMGRT